MAYRVLALDLDGTLTNSQKQITPKTRQALEQAQQAGIKIVLASGRPTYGIVPLAKELKLDEYGGFILSFNGGCITNCQTQEIIYEKIMPPEIIQDLYHLSKQFAVNLFTYESDHIISEITDDTYTILESNINHMPIQKVENFPDYITFPLIKCMMVGDGNHMAMVEKKVQEAVGDRLSVYRSEPFFLEIMSQNVDKAEALSQLLSHLGYTREELAACGDGFNDLSMIRFAGLGAAMANAQQPVKDAADIITYSNDEDGVAHVIETFLLKS